MLLKLLLLLLSLLSLISYSSFFLCKFTIDVVIFFWWVISGSWVKLNVVRDEKAFSKYIGISVFKFNTFICFVYVYSVVGGTRRCIILHFRVDYIFCSIKKNLVPCMCDRTTLLEKLHMFGYFWDVVVSINFNFVVCHTAELWCLVRWTSDLSDLIINISVLVTWFLMNFSFGHNPFLVFHGISLFLSLSMEIFLFNFLGER